MENETLLEIKNGKTYKMVKGDIFIMPPNTIHRFTPNKESTMGAIHIFYPIFDYMDFLNFFNVSYVVRNHDIYEIVGNLITLYNNSKYIIKDIIKVKSLGFQLLDKLTDIFDLNYDNISNLNNMERLLPVVQYIDINWNKKIKLLTLSNLINVSENHFIKIFKDTLNVSPIKYQLGKKIKEAMKLLEGSKYNIAQIADLTGFEDQFYFSRQFKKHIGSSPMKYRKSFM